MVEVLQHFLYHIAYLAMSSAPSETSNRDPLQNLLDEAESELRRRLEEACEAEAKGVSTESTEQIRELENNLLSAALAAKQTVALRSRMKRRKLAKRERPITVDVAADRGAQTDPSVTEGVERAVTGVREFVDDDGKSWRAWSVVPGLSKASASSHQMLGQFQDGWICFEGVGTPARRRLPYPRAKWPTITDQELRDLLKRAIDAPIRQKKIAEEAPITR
jgi:hypothetical protein